MLILGSISQIILLMSTSLAPYYRHLHGQFHTMELRLTGHSWNLEKVSKWGAFLNKVKYNRKCRLGTEIKCPLK